jgi:hypothetical protein
MVMVAVPFFFAVRLYANLLSLSLETFTMFLSDEVTLVMVVVYREYENVSPTYIVRESPEAAYTDVGASTANAVTTNTSVRTIASNFFKCFIKFS